MQPSSRQQETGLHKGIPTIVIMNVVFAVFLCAAILLGTGIQGVPTTGKGRCMCPSTGSNVHWKHLRKVEIFPASSSCDRVEIIATLKTSGERQCLDPDSRAAQVMLARIAQNRASANAGRRRKGAAGRSSPQ
ncbi:C-X-C motif chemokine 10-like [Sphaerodactylus townsendi]|uniref:C-X-C motif chemokine 10-like n=1 Tax=Sphaerodactylus townsendi TaxID=933632 RepID=UPI002026C10F|nr:C-X-C motif chemokine 10-like [Sphaerodactylus townsendi]